MVKARVAGWPHRAHVIEGDDGKLDAMKAATVALACSGTVTTELALAGCPDGGGLSAGAGDLRDPAAADPHAVGHAVQYRRRRTSSRPS